MEARLPARGAAAGVDPAPAPAQIDMLRTVRQHDMNKFPLICALERSTKKFITIDCDMDDAALAKCHSQQQSPLFQLPAELRNMIYTFAAQPKASFSSAIMKANAKPDTRFLLTCRRVWLEGNSYPLSEYTPDFWTTRGSRWENFMDNLTPVNVRAFLQVHITVEVNPIRDSDGVAILESLPFQAWPPKLIVSFMSKPICQEDHADLGACIARMLRHPKIGTICELEINVEEIKSQADYLPGMLAQLSSTENQLFELGISDWKPIIDLKPIRSWHREATNMLPYETYRLVYKRRTGTGQSIPSTWTGDRNGSWHLIPWRRMFYNLRTLARLNFSAEDALVAEYQGLWAEQNSLLKFAD